MQGSSVEGAGPHPGSRCKLAADRVVLALGQGAMRDCACASCMTAARTVAVMQRRRARAPLMGVCGGADAAGPQPRAKIIPARAWAGSPGGGPFHAWIGWMEPEALAGRKWGGN